MRPGRIQVGEDLPAKVLLTPSDYNELVTVGEDLDAWKKNVANLKKLVADNKRISQEVQQVSASIDAEIVRARKLLKKNPKLVFSKSIREKE
jgi:hypothetical protein